MTRSVRFVPSILAVVLLAGCGDAPSASEADAPERVRQLREVDPDASRLLDGGVAEFKRRLRTARGRPVVVNQWASWCGPCRAEFPFLSRQAIERRGKVAFLGVSSRDSRSDALAFLMRHPTPFPHIADPDANVAREMRGGRSWPTTSFYDRRGRLNYTKQGSYRDERALAADIDRYARP